MNETRRPSPAGVDPRAPRFGQAITATVLVFGIGLQLPALVYMVAALLLVAVLTDWRLDVLAILWRQGPARVLAAPTHRDHPAPHRFAKLVGAAFTGAASVAFVLEVTVVGYTLAAVVAVLAALGATTGLCLGCTLYREVSVARRLGLV